MYARVNTLEISKYSVLRAFAGRRKNTAELFIFINMAVSGGEALSPSRY